MPSQVWIVLHTRVLKLKWASCAKCKMVYVTRTTKAISQSQNMRVLNKTKSYQRQKVVEEWNKLIYLSFKLLYFETFTLVQNNPREVLQHIPSVGKFLGKLATNPTILMSGMKNKKFYMEQNIALQTRLVRTIWLTMHYFYNLTDRNLEMKKCCEPLLYNDI